MKRLTVILLCLFMASGLQARLMQRNLNMNLSIPTDIEEVKQEIEDVKDIYSNTKLATSRTKDAVGDLASSRSLDQYQDKTAFRESLSQMDAEELDIIANPQNHSIEDRQYVADKFNETYTNIRGVDSAESNFYENLEPNSTDSNGIRKDKATAFTDGNPGKDDTYYDAKKTQKQGEFVHALGHEGKRQDQIEKGIKNNTPDGVSTVHDKAAYAAGKHTSKALEREMLYKGVKVNKEGRNSFARSPQDKAVLASGKSKTKDVQDAQTYTVYVHGTWSNKESTDPKLLDAIGNTFNEEVEQHGWSGRNSKEERDLVGKKLAEKVSSHKFKEGEKLNVVGHSHGGNVIKEFTQAYDGDKKIDNMVILGTPQRTDHTLDRSDLDSDANLINVFNSRDYVQSPMGTFGKKKGNGRTLDGAKNLHTNIKHTDLDTSNGWNSSVNPLFISD